MSSKIDELLEETYEALKAFSRRVEVIDYSIRGKKAIDIASSLKRGNIFIKITTDAYYLDKDDISELIKSSAAYSSAPLVVSSRIHGRELEDDIVYERGGIYLVKAYTLKSILSGKEVFILNTCGSYIIKINAKKMKALREELGLSLGELADRIGVSRKAVYEYERGNMHVSIDTALKLIEVLGEEIVEPIDIFKERSVMSESAEAPPDVKLEEKIMNDLRKMEFRVIHLKRMPVDIVGRRDDGTVSFVIKHTSSSRNFNQKVEEARKIANIARTELIVVKDEEIVDFAN